MIYAPREAWSLRSGLAGGAQVAGALAAIDFLAGNGKPWSFYLGVAFGSAAAATGTPGLAASMYVIGDSVDFLLFKSPDGSDVRLFLNGIAYSSIDAYAAANVWEWVSVNGLNPQGYNRVDVLNYQPSPNPAATGTPWLALSDVRVNGQSADLRYGESWVMANYRISISFLDADGATSNREWHLVAADDATALTRAQSLAEAVDDLTDCLISDVAVIKVADTSGWSLKSAYAAGADNEIGGRFVYATAGDYSTRISIPGFKKDTYTVSGGAVNTAHADIITFNTLMATGGFADYRYADIQALRQAYETFGNKG